MTEGDQQRYDEIMAQETLTMGRECSQLDAATLRDGDTIVDVVLYETRIADEPVLVDGEAMVTRRCAVRAGNHTSSSLIADTRWERVP